MLVLLCYAFRLAHTVISRQKVTELEMLCKIPYLLYNVYIHGQISNYTSQVMHNKLTILITRSVRRSIAPVEIKSRIQDNKNKNVQNNNEISGAVWLRTVELYGSEQWSCMAQKHGV